MPIGAKHILAGLAALLALGGLTPQLIPFGPASVPAADQRLAGEVLADASVREMFRFPFVLRVTLESVESTSAQAKVFRYRTYTWFGIPYGRADVRYRDGRPVGGDAEGGLFFPGRAAAPPTSDVPSTYTTRELALRGRSPQGLTLWEGAVIYSDVVPGSEPGQGAVSRIVAHDLATERETVLIEARPPHTAAYALHRSGDWLYYYETHPVASVPPVFDPPQDYYAFDLRGGERHHLPMLPGAMRPGFGGGAFGDGGFAYVAHGPDSRLQLRYYALETGEDRLLFVAESPDTVLADPVLHAGKVLFSQGRREEWPPGFRPTPIPGRPGPWPPPYRVTGDVFSLDLATGETVNLSATGSASQPAAWGDHVMWIDRPAGGGQQHGSGEVFVLNTRTGQRKRLTEDATYLHAYSSPLAGEGFFVWHDARPAKDRLPVYFPESDEIVYLPGPGGAPTLSDGRPDGKALFWGWSGETTAGPPGPTVDLGRAARPGKVYVTTFP